MTGNHVLNAVKDHTSGSGVAAGWATTPPTITYPESLVHCNLVCAIPRSPHRALVQSLLLFSVGIVVIRYKGPAVQCLQVFRRCTKFEPCDNSPLLVSIKFPF